MAASSAERAAAADESASHVATQDPAPVGADASQGAALDRIEVTGTRIDRLPSPVEDDARLEPTQWLERIRERRDGDDLDGARASLRLFRTTHPHLRLPDDLRDGLPDDLSAPAAPPADR